MGSWLLTGRVFLLVGGFSPTASAEVVVASAVVVAAAAVMVIATLTTSGTVGRASRASPTASPTDVGWIVRWFRPDIQAGEALHHVVVRRQE